MYLLVSSDSIENKAVADILSIKGVIGLRFTSHGVQALYLKFFQKFRENRKSRVFLGIALLCVLSVWLD